VAIFLWSPFYQKVPRCVYISSELYEYKELGRITWGSTYTRKYVANFKSGLRELVKTGFGAKVAPFLVEPTTLVDATNDDKELPQNFLHWLEHRKLSTDDRRMRLEEWYIKKGNMITVMGVICRRGDVLPFA